VVESVLHSHVVGGRACGDAVEVVRVALRLHQRLAAAVRAILSTYTKIDPTVQKNLVLPKWPSEVDRDSVELLGDLATKDGLITKSLNLDSLLP
jgi:NitT/TauT family transport system substrate-binding protein